MDLHQIATRIAADALTFTIETEEIPDEETPPEEGKAMGSVEITRSDGKKITGKYTVEGGVGSLRGGGWWDELENQTELDEETAGKALMIAAEIWAGDLDYEEPYTWDKLIKGAQEMTGW